MEVSQDVGYFSGQKRKCSSSLFSLLNKRISSVFLNHGNNSVGSLNFTVPFLRLVYHGHGEGVRSEKEANEKLEVNSKRKPIYFLRPCLASKGDHLLT